MTLIAPLPTPPMTVAEFLARQLDLITKTQREIAEEVGFESPNVLTMLKQGRTKLPLDRIPRLAEAIGVSPAHLLRLALAEYHPTTLAVIEDVLAVLVSDNERALIALVREVSGGADPAIAGKRQQELITEAFTR